MIVDNVKGNSKVFGVIGTPISHTFSPTIHNTIAKELGHNSVYIPFLVEKDFLQAAVKGAEALNISGINVTIPHKTDIMEHLYKLDETAMLVGAVNTLKKTEYGYIGYNTDIIGIRETFIQNNVTVKGKNVLVLGAGGGANSAVSAALAENASEIYIVNRTLNKAYDIVENAKKYYNKDIKVLSYDGLLEIEKPDIVIQTTSVGFSGQINESPIKDKSFFKKVEVCLDIIYNPWETLFLKDAKTFSVKCINGFEMLIYQAIASYEIWNDIVIENKVKKRLLIALKDYFQNGLA